MPWSSAKPLPVTHTPYAAEPLLPVVVVVSIEPPVRTVLPVDSILIPAAPCPLVLIVRPSASTTELGLRTSMPKPAAASALVVR
ncbi:hypothetical protein [Achromobacter denitrificans]|uniref:Uncharacterized protein n=1 Tax=Achromobacter denitrificans TaxID=32002 RepID=A0A6N0JG54_ACHDE|nr:hypothetical protein [Achromobacter denitrificans]QKQ46017.1 hypothetical protein FOC81_04630 [Achromobacter denitrificans]